MSCLSSLPGQTMHCRCSPARRSSAQATQSATVLRICSWKSSSSLSGSLVYASPSAAVITTG